MIIKRRNIVVGLDIGTSGVKAAVGEINYEHNLTVLGFTRAPSNGLRKGNIIDIEHTARSVDLCLNDLERLTGVEITSAWVGFSGASVNAVNNHAIVAVSNPGYEISIDDQERVLKSACNISLPSDKMIVQTITRQYLIDGYDGVKDPVGMVGSRLEVEVAIIIAAVAAIQNLQRSIQRVNLNIEQIIYSPLLEAEAVLLPAEREIGVAMVDIGAGTVEISVFSENNLVYTSVLPLGGDFITRDLAILLRTSLDEAVRIKEHYGTAMPEQASDDAGIEVRNIQGGEVKKVSQKVVADIINARVEEMMQMIAGELKRSGYAGKLPSGLVLTGGGAELDGMVQVTEIAMNMPVRLGRPDNINCVAAELNKPQNAVALGGLIYAAKNAGMVEPEKSQTLGNVFSRLSGWYRDLFS